MVLTTVNGATLHHEVRGQGPALLFISGAGGDAGPWERVADALADEFTVVTYDRRGNSRSARPAGGTSASIDEQADDAAALLAQLGLAPAVAYGNSLGAVILTNLLLRHPDVLQGAILHEPPYASVTSSADEVGAAMRAMIETGVARGGPRAAMEMFLRRVTSDDRFEALPAELRERLLANGEVFVGLEMPQLAAYLPSADDLQAVTVPCVVAAGVEDRDGASPNGWFYEASQWLATSLGAPFVEVPGSHVPQGSHPLELAEAVRPLLRTFWQPEQVSQ